MRRNKKDIIDDMMRKDRMIADVVAGKTVECPVCRLPLVYYGALSGRHPGIFCPTGCTEILMTLKPRDEG